MAKKRRRYLTEEQKIKRRETSRKWRLNLTDEQKQKQNKRTAKWYRNLTDEQKRIRLDKKKAKYRADPLIRKRNTENSKKWRKNFNKTATKKQKKDRKAKLKILVKKYQQSTKGKTAKARADKKYKQSEKGKIVVKKSGLKYRATEHGRATMLRALKKYFKSEKGKAAHRKFVLKNDYKYQRRWRKSEEGRKSQNLSKKRMLKNNPLARLVATQRSRISQILKTKGTEKKISTLKYIGCTALELKKHLELQFKTGMSWKNYGRDGWEVDHIKPLSSFDLTLEEEKKAAFHFSNQRPEWREDNIKKSDNIIMLKADPNFSQIIFKKLYPSSSKLKDLDDDIKKILKKKDPDLEIGLTVYKKRNGTFQAIVLTPKSN